MLEHLNACRDPGTPYISLHYAPADTASADYREERLFYTRENALFIDGVRSEIEDRYPGWDLAPDLLAEKAILVSLLLYEAATHANTSGVFKAYHKGFGGHSGDSLSRILASMHLEYPALFDGRYEAVSCREDARSFVSGRPADLVYLDPPYNSHQYGSNYFMLNTIARWDLPPVSAERGPDGRFLQKAGIRNDWVETRSAYCSRKSAAGEFSRLLDATDARYIALSYSTEGIIPFEQLAEILSQHGRIHLYGTDYTVYRGGRQSLARKIDNIEFVIVVERAGPVGRNTEGDLLQLRRFRTGTEIRHLLRRPFDPDRLREAFPVADGSFRLIADRESGVQVDFPLEYGYRVVTDKAESAMALSSAMATLSLDALETLRDRLLQCVCADHLDEARVVLSLLDGAGESSVGTDPLSGRRPLVRRLLVLMRKFANRKYRAQFLEFCEEAAMIAARNPDRFPGLSVGIDELMRLFETRMQG